MKQSIASITNPRISLNLLSSEDIQKLHNTTLDILEIDRSQIPFL